jgi:hypothetical protein
MRVLVVVMCALALGGCACAGLNHAECVAKITAQQAAEDDAKC